MRTEITDKVTLPALGMITLLSMFAVSGASATNMTSAGTKIIDCSSNDGPQPRSKVIPSLRVTVCDHCLFGVAERRALLDTYANRAARAGYVIDPHRSSAVRITTTGVLPSGKSYLRALITGEEFMVFEVKAPEPGADLATVTGRMALVMVVSKR